VINVADHERVHLVADTVGGETFWELAGRGRAPGHGHFEGWHPGFFGAGSTNPAPLLFESSNAPQVMTPWELRNHVEFILAHVLPNPQLGTVQQQANRFMANWHALWARYGEDRDGWPEYRRSLDEFAVLMQRSAASMQLVNGMQFMSTLRSMVLGVALADRREQPVADEPRVPAGSVT
jgi:hypothetical protein